MTEVILRYNGTIDEFIGDAILVVFGAPIRGDDDAARAVACAVEMQLAMEEVNRKIRGKGYPEVSMGIGINTGSVIVGNIGSRKRAKYGVVGKTVNLTSRIESYTVGGQILISRETAETCGHDVRIDGIQEIAPKGVQKPITIYEVGGIGGGFNMFLPEKKRAELPELMRPLPVRFSVVEGKNVNAESYRGTVSRMSGLEAEIRTETAPDRLSNLRITLLGAGRNELGELYAEVIENGLADPPGFRVHITSAPPHVHAFIEYASVF
jgi:adenylate cyclase